MKQVINFFVNEDGEAVTEQFELNTFEFKRDLLSGDKKKLATTLVVEQGKKELNESSLCDMVGVDESWEKFTTLVEEIKTAKVVVYSWGVEYDWNYAVVYEVK